MPMKDDRRRHPQRDELLEETSPWRLGRRGWFAAVKRVKTEITTDHLSVVSGGVAYFGFLAIFPALAALIALYGLWFDPAEVKNQIDQLSGVVPPRAISLIEDQLVRLSAAASSTLSWSAVIAIVVALWSANKGSRALIDATNLAYDERETRSWFRMTGVSLSLTLGAIVSFIILVALIAVVPAYLPFADRLGGVFSVLSWLRWPLLAALVLFALAVVYRVAPDRKPPRWNWVTPGSILATLLLVAASAGLSFYVSNFGNFDKTYGSFGAVAILMLWMYVSAFVVLLGAELNHELERRAEFMGSPRIRGLDEIEPETEPGTPRSAHPAAG